MIIFKQNGKYYLPATLTEPQTELTNYVEDEEDFIISM